MRTEIGIEPEFRLLAEKKLIGMRLRMSFANNRTAELWRTFMPRRMQIENRPTADLISLQVYGVGFFDDIEPSREFEKWDAADPRGFRILGEYNYEAYGRMRPVLDTDPSQTRLRYIGKERDEESRLADHGVRKYDYDLGRFTCPDPLWEKYYSWTPYQYAACNPVSLMDGNGLFVKDKDGNTVIFKDNNQEFVKADNGKLYSVISGKNPNCAGHALVVCNGEGPKEIDYLNDIDKAINMDPALAKDAAWDDGYRDERKVEESSTNDLRKGDILFYYDGNQNVVHVAVVAEDVKSSNFNNIIVNEMPSLGSKDNRTVNTTLLRSLENQGGNTFIKSVGTMRKSK